MPDRDRAKLFWNGGSQAVRLPKEYRFEGKEVGIRREGEAVVLEPLTKPAWPRGFWTRLAALPPLAGDFGVPEPLPASEHRDAVLGEIEG